MMDVISSAAIIIQLLGISRFCPKTLRTPIHTTKHVPTGILAISNEINDLNFILSNLESLAV